MLMMFAPWLPPKDKDSSAGNKTSVFNASGCQSQTAPQKIKRLHQNTKMMITELYVKQGGNNPGFPAPGHFKERLGRENEREMASLFITP
jgi:hypothetical protein